MAVATFCILRMNSVEVIHSVSDSQVVLVYSNINTAFHQFCQAKFADVGSVLSSSQFLLLPHLPQKIELASKVVKMNSKIIILRP
jgi:hypothetical protein